MNFDELGHSWREQNTGSSELDSTKLLTSVVRRVERGRITNWLWGAVGLVASLLVLYDHSKLVMAEPSLLVRVGAALVVLAALGCFLTTAHTLWPNQSSSQSVCDYFSRELQRNDKLIAANKSPFTFVFMALLTVGVCLIAAVNLPTPSLILAIALLIGINIVCWWAARRTVARGMTLRQDMEQLLSDLLEDPA